MSYRYQNTRSDDRKEENPLYSRIFVVCSKNLKVDDLRVPFSKFGDIEDLRMPKDRHTGESRGVAYIKYEKTSSAASAIQEMNMKTLENESKPLKVMIASNKSDDREDIKEDKYRRLFIKVGKLCSEDEVRDHFSKFGHLETVHFQKDKHTNENRGFAYVRYSTFYEAAKALEECDRKYKPVFATPKEDLLKRNRNSLESSMDHGYNAFHGTESDQMFHPSMRRDFPSFPKTDLAVPTSPEGFTAVSVSCSPILPQKFIETLFNIIPGMITCQYSADAFNGVCKATVKYEEESQAAHAVDRLNNFEFPSGEIVAVKPQRNSTLTKAADELNSIVNTFKTCFDGSNPDLMQLANVIAQASSLLIKEAASNKDDTKAQHRESISCSVPLPPPQPMANINSKTVQRCFIVFKPSPPPAHIVKDAFCRFGDLIEISLFPGRTFGFAKYASARAAQEAIKTLNSATLCGVFLKVMEANDKPSKDGYKNEKDTDGGVHLDHTESKRMKLDSP